MKKSTRKFRQNTSSDKYPCPMPTVCIRAHKPNIRYNHALLSTNIWRNEIYHLLMNISIYLLHNKNPRKWHSHTIYKGSHSYRYLPNFYAFICFATSSAKFSSFFSSPSPVSKRTNLLTESFALFSLATCSIYFATVCLPSSAFT